MSAPAVRDRPVRGARTWAQLGWLGLMTVLLRRHDPIVGSLILTDRCNLACRHCVVANIRRADYPFAQSIFHGNEFVFFPFQHFGHGDSGPA